MTSRIARAAALASLALPLTWFGSSLRAQPSAGVELERYAQLPSPPLPPPPLAPAARPKPEPERAEVPIGGRVHLVLFTPDNRAAANAVVQLAGGRTLAASADGGVFLRLPAGAHQVKIALSPAHPFQLVELQVVHDETTAAIYTFGPDGRVADEDLLVPEEAAERAAVQTEVAGHAGRLRGRVFSAEQGAPVEDARVYVAGHDAQATTDAQGRFVLELPEGTHTLSVIHTKFATRTLDDVVVKPEEVTSLEIEATPVALELDEFVVTAPHVQGGVASVMDERRATAAVTDAVGAEDIARMPASDAAQAAQRVVGATIVGGRFVYVRGLGERYSNALLNGAPLPSPEPDRATVPLDLFPAKLLDSLDIAKTFTPDVPADFAGGSVRIVTRAIPEEPLFSVSLSAGYNSESTFQDGYGQEASSTDWLGFDDGMRALPPEVPDDYQLSLGFEKPNEEVVLRPELNEQAKNLDSSLAAQEIWIPPSVSGSVLWGRGFDLGGDRKLGVLTSLLYSRGISKRRTEFRDFQRQDLQAPDAASIEYDIESVTRSVRWGAFASSRLALSEEHSVGLVGMHSQLADANTDLYEGFAANTEERVGALHKDFISRGLSLGQLDGDHRFDMLDEALLEWTLSLGRALRDEPDSRDVVYTLPRRAEEYAFLDSSESGRHFFSEMAEIARFAKLDWTQPLIGGDFETKLKLGGMITLRDREFRARRFNLQRPTNAMGGLPTCGETFDPVRCPAEAFAEENIGSILTLSEGTDLEESYNAELDVHAAYLMTDMALGPHVRMIAGARVENTKQSVAPYDQFNDQAVPQEGGSLSSFDLLPAASIVVSPTEETNVRLSVSRTIARPQLREIAPFAYTPCFGCARESGNPDLELTKILNGDLRFEYFPSSREVLAASVFVKDFDKPIEPQIIPSSTQAALSYQNAEGAFLYGVEVEARKSLDFIAEPLDDFTLIASLMLADSSINVVRTGNLIPTNLERRLVYQAPYVVNVALDYDGPTDTQIRLLYNVSGPTLVEVGVQGLDDVYEHPRHVLDLSAAQTLFEGFKVRLTVQNMLNAEVLRTQGPQDLGYNVRRRYIEGVSASLGASYTF